jgi:dolichol-phosphate mannosyltransferase
MAAMNTDEMAGPVRKAGLYLVVPVYNEVDNLERLFGSFRQAVVEFGRMYDLHIVLVDDGSTDGTAKRATELARGLRFVLLRQSANQGPGSAFGVAFEHLATQLNSSDWVLTLEGDNTSRYDLLRYMFRRAEEGYDVVLASPYLYGGRILNTSPFRVFVSHIANAFVKEFLGVHGIMTVSSFFRLYRAPVILRLQSFYGPRIIERRGFECMIELLLKMVYLGTTISEVPMVLDTNLRAGKSKMKIARTVFGYFALARRLPAWRATAATPSVSEPRALETVA